MNGSHNAFLVHCPDSGSGDGHGDEAVFAWNPNPFFLQIGDETAVGATGDFKTDPFFLFRDPAEGIAPSGFGFSTC